MLEPHTERPRRVRAAGVATVMLVLAFSLWTVIPFAWIWIGSKISTTQAPSAGPYMLVFVGIVCSIIAVALALSWLNGLFAQLMGTTDVRDLPRPEWLRSLSDQRHSVRNWTLLEAIIVTSLFGAAIAMALWFFLLAGSSLTPQ